MKGRGGSGAPIINAMGKALMANFTPSKNGGRNLENFADIFTSKDGSLIPNKHRAFLMDTQVKYTVVSIETSNFPSLILLSTRLKWAFTEIPFPMFRPLWWWHHFITTSAHCSRCFVYWPLEGQRLDIVPLRHRIIKIKSIWPILWSVNLFGVMNFIFRAYKVRNETYSCSMTFCW